MKELSDDQIMEQILSEQISEAAPVNNSVDSAPESVVTEEPEQEESGPEMSM